MMLEKWEEKKNAQMNASRSEWKKNLLSKVEKEMHKALDEQQHQFQRQYQDLMAKQEELFN